MGSLIALVYLAIVQVIKPVPEIPTLIPFVEYEDGKFTQRTAPSFGPPIQGTWSASIYNESKFYMCGGGGNGTYSVGSETMFDADGWTNGDCSGLVEGANYLGRASWSWINELGQSQTVSLELEFTY
jgi:hypothetical protein